MAKKGSKLSEEHKRKIGESNRGKKRTKEQKLLLSIAHLGNSSHLGCKATPEQRKKMSESAKGNTSHLGHKCSKESKKRMSESAKAAWARKSKEQRERDIQRFVNASACKTSDTSIELKVEDQLKKYDIKYAKQKPLCKGHFFVDFYLPRYKLVIECNGNYWHELPNRKARDKELEEYVLSKGRDILWLWQDEIQDDWFDIADYLEV